MTSGLGNNEKNIAEPTSHEVGHNLNLSHDGKTNADGTTTGYYTGHGDWAPIMGVGYYKPVSQRSKGEYPGANQFQDDLAVMQTYGIALISDDHGNVNSAATVLSGTSISATGIIASRADVDVFQFSTGSGNVTINVNAAPRGANLDIEARISDANGNVVATVNPAGLTASVNQYLSAGVYYLTIDGMGAGDLTTGYNDYASIGQYGIAGTLAATNAQPPVASVTANPISGTAPLTVGFSSVNSTDPDGTIAAYSWNFGDGSVTTTEPNPVHTYTSAGTFTAVLTVTDNSGLTDADSIVITVTPAQASVIYVGDIAMSLASSGRNTAARAVITVKDANGAAIPNVTVTGNWSGLTSGAFTAVADASGRATVTSANTKRHGTFTVTVTNLSASGYVYNSSQNVVTSASISY
jgi:PKD repeat protein